MDNRLAKETHVGAIGVPTVLAGALVITIAVGWELAVHAGAVSPLFFPPPSSIAKTLYRLIETGELAENLGATMKRVFLALLTGGSAGFLLGMAMGWSQRIRMFLDPLVAATHNIPKIAVLPLVMLILGVGEFSRVTLLSLAAFFPMAINAMAGVRQISPIHFEVAQNYGASRWKVFSRVVFPGSLPMVLTGLRLAFNVALMLTIAIELVIARKGLGVMIWFAWETLRTEELFAGLSVAAALGIGFNFLLLRMSHWLVHWQVEREV